jgi:hypothetical protein
MIWNSFFGSQEGDFTLSIKSIKAVSPPTDLEKGFTDTNNEGTLKPEKSEKAAVGARTAVRL